MLRRSLESTRLELGPPTTRRRFHPHAFVASQETIFILSKEGSGSASPLTTALTVAIAEAVAERAERSGGRLPKPALFALDESANVVRWPALPDQFSHYGSKGLIVMGILQSWSQGVVLASGAPANLLRTMPWYTGAHKDGVEASIKKYSPRPEEEAVPVANPWVTGLGGSQDDQRHRPI